MTDNEYLNYLNESYGSDAHLYENVYNEGLGQAINNGIQKVKNFFSTAANNSQAKLNTQRNNAAQDASTVAASAPTSEENLKAALSQIAMDIVNVQKGGFKSGQWRANSAQKKADKDAAASTAAGTEAGTKNKEATKTEDPSTGTEEKAEANNTTEKNESLKISSSVNRFFEELKEGELTKELSNIGLTNATNPNSVSDFLFKYYQKQPDAFKTLLDKLTQFMPSAKNHIASAQKALAQAEQEKKNQEAQNKILGNNAQAGGESATQAPANDNTQADAAPVDNNTGADANQATAEDNTNTTTDANAEATTTEQATTNQNTEAENNNEAPAAAKWDGKEMPTVDQIKAVNNADDWQKLSPMWDKIKQDVDQKKQLADQIDQIASQKDAEFLEASQLIDGFLHTYF